MNDLIEREAAVGALKVLLAVKKDAQRTAPDPLATPTLILSAEKQTLEGAIRTVKAIRASTRHDELERLARELLATATVSGPEYDGEARADVCVAALCDLKAALAALDGGEGK